MLNIASEQKTKILLNTENKNNNNLINIKDSQYFNIKKNIMDLFLGKDNLYKNRKKYSSQPNSKYNRFNLKMKNKDKIYDKKVSQVIKADTKYTNNKEEKENIKERPINLDSKNEFSDDKLNINKISSTNFKENEIMVSGYTLNNVINSSSDINKYLSIGTQSYKDNSSQKIKVINTNDNTSDINLFDNKNLHNENFSNKSSKNGSSKNIKNNKKIPDSNLSTSSINKNFVLKSELCKSAIYNDNIYYYNKNTRSEGNPIVNYFSQDFNNEKNIKNFYLSTARKSIEEIDQTNYINFFPIEEDSNKKLKNIMSCNYIDKGQIHEQIFTEELDNEDKDFSFAEFQNRENDKNIHKLELIKKKAMKYNNDNKDINQKDENKIILKDINNNKGSPDINNNITTELKAADLVKSSLEKLVTNYNEINNFNLPENNNTFLENKVNDKMPLSFVNNIYYINNSNYKQYQINPIYNNTNQNLYNGLNTNQNQNMNYFFNNYPESNNYNYINNNQNNNGSLNILMRGNNNDNIKSKLNNNINNNYIPKMYINNNYILNMNTNKSNNKNEAQNNINSNDNESTKINKQNISTKNLYEYTNEEILDLSIILIKEQIGCRFMQEKVKSDNNFANESLFPKIKYNLKELCCDSFGNYFLQALIEVLSFDNINKFFDITQCDFTDICNSPHGTRVIQKIIEKISPTPILINRFIYNLTSKDLGIIFKSPYGNHVIQKFLATNVDEYSNFIYNYVSKNFMDIAQSKHGVCIIQKCVSLGNEIQREKIYKLILNNFTNLIKDQFGNYLIQYILINTHTEDKFKEIFPLIKKIEENMLDLCKSKFSANAIEKCFENKENISKDYLFKSLVKLNSDKIKDILLDNYGIYVIQKALKFSSINEKNKLYELILEKANDLKSINLFDYKYKVIQKVINSSKELGEIFSKIKNNYYSEQLEEKNYYENNMNNYNNFNNNYNNNRGKNKKGKKYYKGKNNQY